MAVLEGSDGFAWLRDVLGVNGDLQAAVTLKHSNLSGIAVRYVDENNYYGVRLHVGDVIELFRKAGGMHTTLAVWSAPIANDTPYELRLRVRGRHPVVLEGWFDSVKVFDTSDTTSARIVDAGRVGLLSGHANPTHFDDVIAKKPAPLETVANTLLLHETFTTCVDNDPPDAAQWSFEGNYYCRAQQLRGESAGDLALLHGVDAYNAEVRARVRLTTEANDSGVVARAENGSYYVARLDQGNQVRLERVDSSGSTLLAGYSTTIAPETSYRLELRVVGWLPVNLDFYLAETHLISYTDDSPRRLTTGDFGLLSGSTKRTYFDDVYVTAK